MKSFKILILLISIQISATAQTKDMPTKPKIIWTFELNREIDALAVRIVNKNISAAEKQKADYIIMQLNTYGGALAAADDIRTKILNCKIPVMVFINNQAASAGALISIACDSIYMHSGGSIGAATVVDQTGEVLPDKYQSFMRSMMRATAEAHGKKTVVKNGKTVEIWHRDPQIAQAMVDPSISIEGIVEYDQVLTFTTQEAIRNGYCEGEAENINQALQKANISNYQIVEYKAELTDLIINFLLNPIVQGILILLMFGGIYFELQTPGIGFPLGAAVFGAIFYFAPLYIEGLAQNWEIIIFIIGIILLLVEIFVIPGWGIAGISGIILIITGLTMSMIDNNIFRYENEFNISIIVKPLALVVTSILISGIGIIYFGKKILQSRILNISLHAELNATEGFVSVETSEKSFIGIVCTTITPLNPSGKVMINNEIYTAIAEYGFIEKGESVTITRFETGQLYCEKNRTIES
ncbi:MAG: ATP-dependent Clp protease proteolytic subunit [Prevotellaceae bacterium]|jgi:membrane-bound serine protease (ClpP class)|nr:ATP-dependent Clp protease proteolytic subunit [Prevotellaceae bacterium]